MQLVDLIEKRRFVGREFLLWLWLESELGDATLSTAEHGSFGLWIESKLVLSAGKESTRITAPMPGQGREAKEALRRGQLPQTATLHIALGEDETSLTLEAESFAVRGLKLKTLLDAAGDDDAVPGDLVDEMAGRKPGRPKAKRPPADEEGDANLDALARFQERMALTHAREELLAALYRDFLALRLARAWDAAIVPAMRRWAAGEEVDLAAYRKATKARGGGDGRAARVSSKKR
ncbi:MAG: hypothetical protein K8W52_01210 [Deltaproteobacteria bacterium]|nr:hypothetical protein [Deltaproteobacteria bacterium]